MKRLVFVPALLVLVAALLAGGWIFHTQATVEPAYAETLSGDMTVAVRFEAGPAAEAAEWAANAYHAAGWEELPVSTRTFRLFARGARTAALLAEDAPSGGARVTEFRRGDL